MKNILEIIVLYIYINVYSFQIISIDYMQLSNSYNIQYRIDQLSNRHEYAAIDLSFDYTLLVIPNFTPYYTYIRKNILLLNETRNILEYESKLELSESQLQLDLPVNIIDNIDDSKKYVESKIGLSYKYDDERFLSIDLDLSSYASEVCEKYKEFFGAELDRSRIKLISFLRYT